MGHQFLWVIWQNLYPWRLLKLAYVQKRIYGLWYRAARDGIALGIVGVIFIRFFLGGSYVATNRVMFPLLRNLSCHPRQVSDTEVAGSGFQGNLLQARAGSQGKWRQGHQGSNKSCCQSRGLSLMINKGKQAVHHRWLFFKYIF